MDHSHDHLFNFVQSLPVLGHSEAIVYRQLGSIYKQPLSYIPDYGGVVEIPKVNLKHHSLNGTLPFERYPKVYYIKTECSSNPIPLFISQDCLFVISATESDDGRQLNTIQAVGKNIHFNLIQEDFANRTYASTRQHNVSYQHYISGIKFRSIIPDLLLVKFDNGIKTIKLDDHDGSGELGGFSHYGTFLEKRGLKVQDASMNFATKSLLAVGSENSSVYQVKLYDLIQSNYSKQPCHTITWPSDSNDAIVIRDRAGYLNDRQVRGSILKTYVAQSLSPGLRQLDNIPSHIANLLVTTICKTILIDPRMEKIGQMYVDKTKASTFHPVEYLKRTEFSHRNTYQFYSLTNLNLRVFDSRFPGMPMNQVSHMLSPARTNSMNMRVMKGDSSQNETLCLTSRDRLSFLAFDQTQKTDIINPKSMHMPFHSPLQETVPNDKVENMFGLAMVPYENCKRGTLFSVLQLNSRGDIYMRNYEYKQEVCPMDIGETSRKRGHKLAVSDKQTLNIFKYQKSRDRSNLSTTKFKVKDSGKNCFDILEQEVDYEIGITSTRALERSKKTRNILNKIC